MNAREKAWQQIKAFLIESPGETLTTIATKCKLSLNITQLIIEEKTDAGELGTSKDITGTVFYVQEKEPATREEFNSIPIEEPLITLKKDIVVRRKLNSICGFKFENENVTIYLEEKVKVKSLHLCIEELKLLMNFLEKKKGTP